MDTRFKYYCILSVFLIVLLSIGCSFKGTPLTSSGVDYEPHMVWNGSHFGIVHYHSSGGSGSGAWPDIDVKKVDKNGGIVVSKNGAGSIQHLYAPFILSNLVWNSKNQQFAFAYTKDKVIHFIRMDASLNVIGSPLIIQFPGLQVDSMEHPRLVDLSLVWNDVKNQYGLTYVTEEHPYLQDRHDDIYISRISASGNFVGPYARHHIVTCPGDCEKTSLSYNTKTGQYALSYFKNNFPQHHVTLGLLKANGIVSEHTLMAGWNPGWGRETKVIFDDRTDDYVVTALKDKPGSLHGHELCYQIADSNGQPKGNYFVRSGVQGYDKIISIGNYLSPVKNRYLICASEQQQIHCWVAAETGHVKTDIGYTSKNVNSWHPSLSVVDGVYLSWIQDGSLYFGKAKK